MTQTDKPTFPASGLSFALDSDFECGLLAFPLRLQQLHVITSMRGIADAIYIASSLSSTGLCRMADLPSGHS